MSLAYSTLDAESYAEMNPEDYAFLLIDPAIVLALAAQSIHCNGSIASVINSHSVVAVHSSGAVVADINNHSAARQVSASGCVAGET